jgi:integrase
MSEAHRTAPARTVKPAKPYPEFPLGPHPAGYWCKRIRGQLHYFGPRFNPADPQNVAAAAEAALDEYEKQKDDLHAGRKPRPDPAAVTVDEACAEFLFHKRGLVETGELSPQTLAGYERAVSFLTGVVDKKRLMADLGPDDFATLRNRLAKRYGPHGLGTAIQCVRCVCKYACDAGLIDRPIRFGPGFKRPSKKVLRLHKAKQGPKLFTAEEIHALVQGVLVVGNNGPELVKAGAAVKAQILLGINCGFGNTDCGTLPLSAIDWDKGIIDFPRPKTGIPRRCPLWPETVEAIKEALAHRPKAKKAEHDGLVFITQRGLSWAKDIADSPLTKEVAKLLKALGINGRHRLGFYTLRHTFRTVADEAKDQPATDFIMGHEVPHMSSVYRETISDKRLKAVTDHVRAWLYAEPKKDKLPAKRDDEE